MTFKGNLLSQALALLADYVDKEDASIKIGAIMGLGLAYAGSQNEQVGFLLSLSNQLGRLLSLCLKYLGFICVL